MRGELVSLPGQALAAQTLSIKGREERVGDGSDVLICAFTRDHDEESLPLPRVGHTGRHGNKDPGNAGYPSKNTIIVLKPCGIGKHQC